MRSLNIEIGDNQKPNGSLIVDINELPHPVAIYFADDETIVLNRFAKHALGLKEKMAFSLRDWLKINPYLRDLIRMNEQEVVLNQKTHIVLLNKKHFFVNYSYRCFTDLTFGKIFLINFSKASVKYSVSSISALYSIKADLLKLKPFLNKFGKKLFDSIIDKYFRVENQDLTIDDLVYYEKELRIFEKKLPMLTHREVILCGLLINYVDTKEISTITNRSLDSVFVTIHRINKKLNLQNKKELVHLLEAILKEEQESIELPDEWGNF